MIVDFHTHIFPGDIKTDRHAFFFNEPEFRTLYQDEKSRIATVEELIAQMDNSGVDRSVVFGFPWQTPDNIMKHNDYMMDSVARYPDRLIGFSCFGFGRIDPGKEIERCADGGLVGVGEIGFYHGGLNDVNVAKIAPAMGVCRDLDLPILIHVNEPIGHQYPGKAPMTTNQIYAFVNRFDENRIILAHWGGGLVFYGLLKREVKTKLKNVYFDTAASPYLYDKAIYRAAVDAMGSNHILFGSDFPLIPQQRYFKEMKESGISDEAFKHISGGNAVDLLNLRD